MKTKVLYCISGIISIIILYSVLKSGHKEATPPTNTVPDYSSNEYAYKYMFRENPELEKRKENAYVVEEYYLNYPDVPSFEYMFNIVPEDNISVREDGEIHIFLSGEFPSDAIEKYQKAILDAGFTQIDYYISDDSTSESWDYLKDNTTKVFISFHDNQLGIGVQDWN